MAWSRMVDMELTDEEKIDSCMPMGCDKPEGPRYPWGLRITLTHAELEKLDLDSGCQIGDVIDLRAFCKVTSISASDGPSGPDCRIELQIESLSVEDELAEDETE